VHVFKAVIAIYLLLINLHTSSSQNQVSLEKLSLVFEVRHNRPSILRTPMSFLLGQLKATMANGVTVDDFITCIITSLPHSEIKSINLEK